MVKFGKTMQLEQKAEYRAYYIDYNGLKKKIKFTVQSFENENDFELLDSQIREFLRQLDYEISKAAVFYEELVEDIARNVASIRRKWPFMSPETLPFVYNQARDTAGMVGDCMKYLELNVEGTRKILKKAEKLTHHTAVSKDEVLKDRLRPDTLDSRLSKLRMHDGMEMLIDEITDRINKMRRLELEWLEDGFIEKRYSSALHSRRDTEDLVNSMYTTTKRAMKHTQWYYGFLNQAQIDYEAEPVGLASLAGLILNNANTFLYMANYYIVIPTANEYANAIGMSKASSGYLLAMTPLSSLLASVVYSKWSNQSFRSPLLFCTVLLVLGNLLYAIALDYRSPAMLFAGRLIVGLGGNRAINRRYIADFVPVESRTFHSAVFVAVGSLGMSFGPAMQPGLSYLNFQLPLTGWTVNNLTAPGWSMLLLWILFFFLVFFIFKEPERKYAHTTVEVPLKPLLEHDFFGDAGSLTTHTTGGFIGRTLRNTQINIVGTTICLWIYFVLKLTQEAIQSSAPLVTAVWFRWSDIYVAYLLGAIGLIVLPANLAVGYIGNALSERMMQFFLLGTMVLGCLLCLIYSASYSLYQYVSGVAVVFIAAQVLEAVNMGLLSKVMPKKMSKGLLNSGFLSTEFGTLGRAFGNIFISIAGMFGMMYLANMVIIPCMVLLGLSLIIQLSFWKKIVPATDLLQQAGGNQTSSILRPSFGLRDVKLLPLALSSSFTKKNDIGLDTTLCDDGRESHVGTVSPHSSPMKSYSTPGRSYTIHSTHRLPDSPLTALQDMQSMQQKRSAYNVGVKGSLSDSTNLTTRPSHQSNSRKPKEMILNIEEEGDHYFDLNG